MIWLDTVFTAQIVNVLHGDEDFDLTKLYLLYFSGT
jgi:hypothetical protein